MYESRCTLVYCYCYCYRCCWLLLLQLCCFMEMEQVNELVNTDLAKVRALNSQENTSNVIAPTLEFRSSFIFCAHVYTYIYYSISSRFSLFQK